MKVPMYWHQISEKQVESINSLMCLGLNYRPVHLFSFITIPQRQKPLDWYFFAQIRVRGMMMLSKLHAHGIRSYNDNTDFDGDEMNIHLPQVEISHAEAYNIVNANNHYIAPTRGDIIRGLVQGKGASSNDLKKKATAGICKWRKEGQ